MRVKHPLADRDAPTPGVATVNGSDYEITGGVVDCPATDARALADAWARRYGVDRERILTNDGDESGGMLVNDDLESKTAAELYDLAKERDVDGRSEMTKAELIAALREHED